jgi:hypothetical protein
VNDDEVEFVGLDRTALGLTPALNPEQIIDPQVIPVGDHAAAHRTGLAAWSPMGNILSRSSCRD